MTAAPTAPFLVCILTETETPTPPKETTMQTTSTTFQHPDTGVTVNASIRLFDGRAPYVLVFEVDPCDGDEMGLVIDTETALPGPTPVLNASEANLMLRIVCRDHWEHLVDLFSPQDFT